MKLIEKNVRSMEHSRIVSRATLSRELRDSVLQGSFLFLAERAADTFHDEFGEDPHPLWFTQRELRQFLTDSVVIEVTVALPLSGDTVIMEGNLVKLPYTVYDHSRVPITVPGPFIEEAVEDYIFPLSIRTARHIGWDLESGLMVFGRRD